MDRAKTLMAHVVPPAPRPSPRPLPSGSGFLRAERERFASDLRLHAEAAAGRLASGDVSAAVSLAHRVRGVGATLGFPDLAAEAAVLEEGQAGARGERSARAGWESWLARCIGAGDAWRNDSASERMNEPSPRGGERMEGE